MKFKRKKLPGSIRKLDGIVSSLALLTTLVMTLLVAGFVVDCARVFCVRQELQTVADTSALAGTYQLISFLPPSRSVRQKATEIATTVAYKNATDGTLFGSTAADSINVTIDGLRMPRKTTVDVSHEMPTLFGKFVGVKAINVAASATAGAYQSINIVNPNQVAPLIVAVDKITNKERICDHKPYDKVTIDYSDDKDKQNAQLIQHQHGLNQSPIVIDASSPASGTNVDLTPVIPDYINNLQVGETIILPLMFNNAKPFESPAKVVGLMGFTIYGKIGKTLTGSIITPITMLGQPGYIRYRSNDLPVQFCQLNVPWKVMLIK